MSNAVYTNLYVSRGETSRYPAKKKGGRDERKADREETMVEGDPCSRALAAYITLRLQGFCGG